MDLQQVKFTHLKLYCNLRSKCDPPMRKNLVWYVEISDPSGYRV